MKKRLKIMNKKKIENGFNNYDDFIIPNHYVGKKDDDVMLR